MSLIDIAARVKLSKDAVKYRINKLVANNVITGFTIVVNPPSLGYPIMTRILFSLTNLTPKREEEFVNYLKKNGNIIHISSVSGMWDYFVTVAAKDLGELDEVVREIRRKFSDIIKEFITTDLIKEIVYGDYSGILK